MNHDREKRAAVAPMLIINDQIRIPESEFEPEQLLGTADEPTVALLSAPIERSSTR